MSSDSLANVDYLSLATFRKTGMEVRTPVWCASQDATIYLFSSGNAGKIKRSRNSKRARVAPCDMRGRITGEWQDAEAEIINEESGRRVAEKALARKYGWQFAVLDFFAKISGRKKTRAYIALRVLDR